MQRFVFLINFDLSDKIKKMKRKDLLQEELFRITEILTRKYHPQKIILFGSFANERIKRWSDLDIAIVKNTQKRFMDRLKEVALLTQPKVGVDFLVYTPEEFEEMKKNSFFFQEEIFRKGNVIYEAGKTNLQKVA